MIYKPESKEELKALIKDENIKLSSIDTSLITDMSELFKGSARKDFSGINTWDTSNVVNMSRMFCDCLFFNESLSFDTSNVVNMSAMFALSENFNSTLDFNTSKVEDMSEMFAWCKNFNQELKFNTSNVSNMDRMFYRCDNLDKKFDFELSKAIANVRKFRISDTPLLIANTFTKYGNNLKTDECMFLISSEIFVGSKAMLAHQSDWVEV